MFSPRLSEPRCAPPDIITYLQQGVKVRPDGTIDPAFTSSNVSNANIENPAPGVFCFVKMPFPPNSAVVSAENSNGQNDTLASVTIDNDAKDGAPTATYDPKLANRQFIVWFRGGK